MKFYKQLEDGCLVIGNKTIPPGHGLYKKAMREIADKKAGLIAFDQVEADLIKNSLAERGWRNGELVEADSELNKVQDGRGTGYVSDWRDYRNALRDWPDHPDFPDSTLRPVFVSTKAQQGVGNGN